MVLGMKLLHGHWLLVRKWSMCALSHVEGGIGVCCVGMDTLRGCKDVAWWNRLELWCLETTMLFDPGVGMLVAGGMHIEEECRVGACTLNTS